MKAKVPSCLKRKLGRVKQQTHTLIRTNSLQHCKKTRLSAPNAQQSYYLGLGINRLRLSQKQINNRVYINKTLTVKMELGV